MVDKEGDNWSENEEPGDDNAEEASKDEIGDEKELADDASVTKEISKIGIGKYPESDNQVVFKFKAYFVTDNVVIDESDKIKIYIDDEESTLPSGINKALKVMRNGEVSKVKILNDYSFSKDFKKQHVKFLLPASLNEEEKSENNFKERLENE